MNSLLIVNGNLVNEGATSISDILIVNGRIETIGSSLQNTKADKTIDASGLTILPGMIDDQVHFREPGMTQKADIATESRAAVAGGITSFMDMPNTIPNTLTAKRLEEKYQLAANKSMANYGFYFGASNDNLEDIKRLDPRSACGIKVFMGASTGNMLVDNPQTLEKYSSMHQHWLQLTAKIRQPYWQMKKKCARNTVTKYPSNCIRRSAPRRPV